MAVIGQIRKKTGLLLSVIVGGMAVYLVGGMFSGNSSMFASKQDQVAIINGEDVKIETFNNIKAQTQALYANSKGQTPDDVFQNQMNRMSWEKVLLEFAYKPEFEKLGLALSNNPKDLENSEEVDVIQGYTVSDAVKRYFGVQGNDLTPIVQGLDQLANIDLTDPNIDQQQAMIRQIWGIYKEREVLDKRWLQKYETLLAKSTYVTKAEGKRAYEAQQEKMSFDHLYLSFRNLADSAYPVSNEEIVAYAKAHANEFASETDERVLKYVEFNILPAGRDSLNAKKKIEDITSKLATQANAFNYARVQSDDKDVFKNSKLADLPFQLRMDSARLDSGVVRGPFMTATGYVSYKIANVLDTVAEESHILLSTQNLDEEKKAAKKVQAEAILARALAGEDFATLARENSEGPSKDKGGELGEFYQPDMVPQFASAVWKTKKAAVIPEVVETQFGYHIINVTKAPSFTESSKYYYIAVTKNFVAGQTTRDEVYAKANMTLSKLGGSVGGFDGLDSTYEVKTASSVRIESQNINGIPDSKSLVYWAFRNEEGALSEKPEVVGKKCLIVGLAQVVETGDVNIEKNRVNIERKVRNEKKATYLTKLLQDNLSDDFNASATKINEIEKGVANAQNVSSQSFNSTYVLGAADEPILVGTAFGLAEGATSKVIIGDQGVFVVKAGKKEAIGDAPESYDSFVQSVKSTRAAEVNSYSKVIVEEAGIEDYRFRTGY